MLPRKDGAAVDVDGPSDYIAFARIKISRAGGSVYVESIDPSLLSDISSSDEGAFTLSYEGIVTGVGTADDGTAVTGAAFTDYETAAIMPYGVECVDDDTNTYTLKSVLGGSLTKYAQRGGVVFHMQPEYVQMRLADGSAKYVLAPASAGTGLVYVYNGTVWENVTAGSEGWGTIVSLMGKDLPGIAGLYAMRGFSVPSVCGTYIKTLTSNKAFIEELVANKAFIEELATKVITLQQDSSGKGGIIKSKEYNGKVDENTGKITSYNTDENKKGWAVDYDGNADFTNMHATNMTAEGGTFNLIKASDIIITGNSSFSGTIESGPLVLKNKEVSGQSYSWSANTNAAELFDSVPSSNKSKSMSLQTDKKTYKEGILIYNLTGLINGISYTKMFYLVRNFIIFLNENLEELLHFDASKEKNSIGGYSYITRIPYATEYIFTNPNSKTLKLIDLPTSEPSETGVVWNDNGILKIKI